MRKEENLMKTFNTPTVEVKKFNVADILTASGEEETPTASICDRNVTLPCLDDD
jgi:hypothetical protein